VSDFLPVEILRSTYMTEGGRMLSFPWTVAVAVMYYNKEMLASVGFDAPAVTWDEFFTQCEAIKQQLNKSCYSMQVDASNFAGMALSYGATNAVDVDARATRFAEEPWTKAIDLMARLVENDYAFPTIGRADEAVANLTDFSSQQAAYIVTSSRWIPFVQEAVVGSFDWSVTLPPLGTAGLEPVTIQYGPNMVAFNTTEAENAATWEFIKFLASPDSQAYWASTSGNLPTRLSVGGSGEYAEFLAANPVVADAWATLPFAVSELQMNDLGNVGPAPFSLRVVMQDVKAEILTQNITREDAQQKLIDDGAAILGPHYARLFD